MTEASTSAETWSRRVAAWRASGTSAELFSRREGYAASTLRWWSSKLKRDTAQDPAVRLARVVRTPSPAAVAHRDSAIVIEAVRAGARVAVETGADRATLAMVLEVLGIEARA